MLKSIYLTAMVVFATIFLISCSDEGTKPITKNNNFEEPPHPTQQLGTLLDTIEYAGYTHNILMDELTNKFERIKDGIDTVENMPWLDFVKEYVTAYYLNDGFDIVEYFDLAAYLPDPEADINDFLDTTTMISQQAKELLIKIETATDQYMLDENQQNFIDTCNSIINQSLLLPSQAEIFMCGIPASVAKYSLEYWMDTTNFDRVCALNPLYQRIQIKNTNSSIQQKKESQKKVFETDVKNAKRGAVGGFWAGATGGSVVPGVGTAAAATIGTITGAIGAGTVSSFAEAIREVFDVDFGFLNALLGLD